MHTGFYHAFIHVGHSVYNLEICDISGNGCWISILKSWSFMLTNILTPKYCKHLHVYLAFERFEVKGLYRLFEVVSSQEVCDVNICLKITPTELFMYMNSNKKHTKYSSPNRRPHPLFVNRKMKTYHFGTHSKG